ncbi:MAG: TIGR02757 family protein [Bacteroidales bacterium]|nr:TIGR02757 family protein [Bacteroidales bacterium]
MPQLNSFDLKTFLDEKVDRYNRPAFIESDPISIPHSFDKKQDIEIMGFFAAVLAWGQRPTIINKCRELAQRMDGNPHQFVTQSSDNDLKQLLGFKHRTFNDTDLLYFVDFLKRHYTQFDSLEDAFVGKDVTNVESALLHFRNSFFDSPDAPLRTRKHISSPAQKSACKRLNMFLRWMVRYDEKGVDFGIWKMLQPKDLICPLDLHVDRTARHFGMISRKQTDWQTALELTETLRSFDPLDPVKYDFALFGISVEKELYLFE